MSHVLEKFYSVFGGLDTSSNPLIQKPKSARGGSKNFRWNYVGSLQKNEGIQHKAINGTFCDAGLIEYKFRDINTGSSVSQVLGVGSNGRLYRLDHVNLRIKRAAGSVVYFYSVIYDNVNLSWRIIFYDSTRNILGFVDMPLANNISTTSADINTLALAGLTSDVVNDSDIVVTPSADCKSYQLDTVFMEELNPLYQDYEYLKSSYWTEVMTSDGAPAFINAIAYKDDPDWEGISSVNSNNAIYITDGGFPFKYDGYTLYKAGMPRQFEKDSFSTEYLQVATVNIASNEFTVGATGSFFLGMPVCFEVDVAAGYLAAPLVPGVRYYVNSIPTGTTFTVSATPGGSTLDITLAGVGAFYLVPPSNAQRSGVWINRFPGTNLFYWNNGTHRVRFQLVHKDPNGVVVKGRIQAEYSEVYQGGGAVLTSGYSSFATNGANQLSIAAIPSIKNDTQFPVYSCKVNIDQSYSVSGPSVLNVYSGHNVLPGMCLRFVNKPGYADAAFSTYYFLVTAVTATTISFDFVQIGVGAKKLVGGVTLNAVYVPSNYIGQLDDSNIAYGPQYLMWSTKTNAADGEDYYIAPTTNSLARFNVPHNASTEYNEIFAVQDSQLLAPLDISSDIGEEIPRACKYLTKWQGKIIQGGRPYENKTSYWSDKSFIEYFSGVGYPSFHYSFQYGLLPVSKQNFFKYNEVNYCDSQSVYWESSEYPEGFATSGLAEESFDNIFNDRVTGMGSNKEALFVFKERSTGYITGALATLDIVKEVLESDVGSANHNCIQEVAGSIIFMDKNCGFWSVITGRLPVFIGNPIQDYFKNNETKSRDQYLNFKRAQATNFRLKDHYICYIPAGKKESGELGPIQDPTASSIAFILDYAKIEGGQRYCWYPWVNINAAGGILATADDELFVSERSASSNRLWKQKNNGNAYDFSNHESPIEFSYKGAFLTAGEPTVDKHWLGLWISSVIGGFSLIIRQYMNFIDVSQSDYQLTMPSGNMMAVKQNVKSNLPKLSGLSFEFYNNIIYENVQIDGWEVELSADFDKGEPKR